MHTQKLSTEEKAEWAARVEQWSQSGMSMAKWCRENQITYHKFLYWRDRFRPVDTSDKKLGRNDFIQLSEDLSAGGLSIICNGCTVQLSSNFDERTLARCLRVLRGL